MANVEDRPVSEVPHIESSDSANSENDVESLVSESSESSGSDKDAEEPLGNENSQATCHVAHDGVKFWTPICEESKKPQLNKHFITLEDAFKFYREYGRICGFDVRKYTKKTDSRGNLYAKYLICNRGASPLPKKLYDADGNVVQGPRRKTSSKRCKCPAQIVLKSAGLRGFVLMGFVEEHNHPLVHGPAKMFLRCNRQVSRAHQQFIVDCSRVNIGATRAHSLVKEMSGCYENVGATIADFKNFKRDIQVRIGEHDTDMLLGKFKVEKKKSKDSFYYDYIADSEGHLTGLFWADAIGQANYQVFGDIVSFDPTFRTNRYNMVFVPFTGVDNHWKNVTFVAGLLSNEKYKSFKWLISTFKKAMGRAPSCVITDQCPAIKKALVKWWPSTKHRLCMWHIMNKLPSKVGPKLASNKKFIEKLKAAVYSDHLSPADFEDQWQCVISEYKLEGNAWLCDMFAIRDQWIPAYFNDIEMAGLLRTTSRSESSNFFFQHYHESGHNLVEFYSSFESAMDKQRLRNADDEKRSDQIPVTVTTMSIELDALKLYTLELYYMIREEIKDGCFHTLMSDMSRDEEHRFFKFKDELLNEKIFEVSVIHSDNHVTCSCKLFFRKGYLCRHAFAALHQCGVKKIPPTFVKPRWQKNALRNYSSLGSPEAAEGTCQRDRCKLKRTRAWFEFQSSISLAGESEENLELVLQGLQAVNSSLESKHSSNTSQEGNHRADAFVTPPPSDEICIRNPSISRNKGCGSRIKSGREVSMQNKGTRKCSICNKIARHNSRTCPYGKQTPES